MSCCTLTKGVKCQGSESHSPPSQILAAVNNQSSSSPRSSHRKRCTIQQFNTISIWENKSFSATLYSKRASSIGHCSAHGFPFCHHCCLRAFQHLWLSSRSSSWLQWWCFHWCHCRDCGCGQCSCDQKNHQPWHGHHTHHTQCFSHRSICLWQSECLKCQDIFAGQSLIKSFWFQQQSCSFFLFRIHMFHLAMISKIESPMCRPNPQHMSTQEHMWHHQNEQACSNIAELAKLFPVWLSPQVQYIELAAVHRILITHVWTLLCSSIFRHSFEKPGHRVFNWLGENNALRNFSVTMSQIQFTAAQNGKWIYRNLPAPRTANNTRRVCTPRIPERSVRCLEQGLCIQELPQIIVRGSWQKHLSPQCVSDNHGLDQLQLLFRETLARLHFQNHWRLWWQGRHEFITRGFAAVSVWLAHVGFISGLYISVLVIIVMACSGLWRWSLSSPT